MEIDYQHVQQNFREVFSKIDELNGRISEVDKTLSVGIATATEAHTRIESILREIKHDLLDHQTDDSEKFQKISIEIEKLKEGRKAQIMVIAAIITVVCTIIYKLTGLDFRI